MKRICIYLTYDKQNIVDKYIGYMLEELKTSVDYIAVVCNGAEIVRGKNILEEYADVILFRENLGFDAGGFKDALCHLLGWDVILKYDELVLVNDSMFGPFKSMKDIFAEMEEKEADFWGIAKHGKGRNDYVGAISEHIQSYFIAIRSKMLHCPQFKSYWEKMPYYTEFSDVIIQHEIWFTHYFSSLGYTYTVLADTEVNDSKNHKNNYSQYMFLAHELIKKRNFPFLKKQPIRCETLDCQTQENLRQAIDYIDKETAYDVDLIWENIIRTMNVTDLQHSLHLQYVVAPEEKAVTFQRIAALVFIRYPGSAETVLAYLAEVKKICDVMVASENGVCLEDYRAHGFTCREIRRQEAAELLMEFCSYDLVCVLQDEDLASDVRPSCVGKSCYYNIWENLAKNEGHIAGISRLFKKEPRLGFLTPPPLNFGEYFCECAKGWGGHFASVQRIVRETDIHCQISELNPPFRPTESFWIRGSILERLNRIKREDDCFLPYMWIYLAQDAGFYSGIVESAEYASMDAVNMQYYLRKSFPGPDGNMGVQNFSELEEKLLDKALAEFCGRYPRTYVYGAGEMVDRHKKRFSRIEAYVVSPGHVRPDVIDGIPVKYVSEISASEDCGIVLCMNERNQKQVIPLLEQYGLQNYFCI